MSVQFPYRAVICGEEHIVKGWRGQKLVTNKAVFSVRHIYGNWQIQDFRLFEVAMIQPDGKDSWLLNGKPLSLLESIRMGVRLVEIPRDENLRVHKDYVRAVAWVDTKGNLAKVTELLDEIIKFWKKAELAVADSNEEPHPTLAELFSKFGESIMEITRCKELLATWSNQIWLTEFRPSNQKKPISANEKQLAAVTIKLEQTQKSLSKAEAVTNDTLKEALSKWMRFDPAGMAITTKARIEKAVKLYLTDKEKMGSLSKIAAEFGVSKKTVSLWFKTFSEETGFRVVTYRRHESVRAHQKADLVQDEEK